ncbi:hypothetical protein K501DRAFT_283539 [Backusella circina FSU 941]|nr:hypothetical protein K501DRAFT_283539 [Backusella circina FSU 941]
MADNTSNTNDLTLSRNLLLTKESEIAALKEVIDKWRNRALKAEEHQQRVQMYYFDQLKALQQQHEVEVNAMEKRHLRKMREKDDMIFSLTEEMNYLVTHREYQEEHIEDDEDEDDDDDDDDDDYTTDSDSIVSSDSTARSDYDNSQATLHDNLKSDAILNSIQDSMREIEEELSFHQKQDYATDIFCSSDTLVNSIPPKTKTKSLIGTKALGKLMKSFPKFFKGSSESEKNNEATHLKYTKSLPFHYKRPEKKMHSSTSFSSWYSSSEDCQSVNQPNSMEKSHQMANTLYI